MEVEWEEEEWEEEWLRGWAGGLGVGVGKGGVDVVEGEMNRKGKTTASKAAHASVAR